MLLFPLSTHHSLTAWATLCHPAVYAYDLHTGCCVAAPPVLPGAKRHAFGIQDGAWTSMHFLARWPWGPFTHVGCSTSWPFLHNCNTMLRQAVVSRAPAHPAAAGGVLAPPLRAAFAKPLCVEACVPRQTPWTRQQQCHGVQTAASAVQESAPAASDAPNTAELLAPQMTWPSRSHGCGTLRASDESTKVTICGWVDRNRNLGGVQFADVRDHTGLLQVCIGKSPSYVCKRKLHCACTNPCILSCPSYVQACPIDTAQT